MIDFFGALEFRQGWLLLLALLAVPVFVASFRPTARMIFSSLKALPNATATWRTRLSWVPDALLGLAAIGLAVALAGPRIANKSSKVRREGIAIMMTVDISGSMRALDLSEGDKEQTRLDAVKNVFQDFVVGKGELAGRSDDAIGIVSFAHYADTRCPLTLSHDIAMGIADSLEIVTDRAEDGTAIGDGLALAVERLRQSKAKSKVVILLTDGVNNVGETTPLSAAKLAKTIGVKVYTIGAGSKGRAKVRVEDPFSGRSVLRSMAVQIDEETLRSIAKETGGQYFQSHRPRGTTRGLRANRSPRAHGNLRGALSRVSRALSHGPHALAALRPRRLRPARLGISEVAMVNLFNWHWGHPGWVHAIWAAIAIVLVLWFLEQSGRAALTRLLTPVMQHRLVDRVSPSRRIARLASVFVCLSAAVVALMRPYVPGGTIANTGTRAAADIVVVLDVSKSMLAEDVAPNRLGRAKAEIRSLVNRLPGHRIGLVAFAGRATMLAPLTTDYGFYRMILRGTNTSSVSRGGTRIGDALREAIKAFPKSAGAKIIILITDGEDHESYPVDAAKEAAEFGIRIFAVGFGSEEGSQILITDPETQAKRPVTDKQGNVVTTRLDGDMLRKLSVELTKGVYVPAATSALDLDSIRSEHIEPIVDADARENFTPRPRRDVPMVCLAIAYRPPERSVHRQWRDSEGPMMLRVLLAVAVLAAGCESSSDLSARATYNRGVKALAKGDLEKAEARFTKSISESGPDPDLRYRAALNLGLTYARKADGLVAEKPEEATN